MSDNDGDKTRIKKPAARVRPAEDATRVAPPKQSADAAPSAADNDKTRIAARAAQRARQLAAARAKAQADKTRVPPSQQPRPNAAADVTRFNPNASPPADKTRVAPPRQSSEIPGSLGAEPEKINVTEVGEHGILKDRFVLESVLGVGGMGIVYKARDLLKVEAQDRDPYVAIKVLSEEFKTHPEAFISLQRESRKSQRIAHPNIVSVYDFDRDKDTVFMTMEFLDGNPLDELIRQYKSTGLPTDDAWSIIHDISLALSHAHSEKIIHSDFKPGNIFVTRKGTAKVFDFGIARAVAQVEHLDDNPDDKTVFDAGNLGALTPAYASLEMLKGEEPDIRDDVYALGCVAYEILTGQHPYNKVPADEAERQGLKPRRISNIKKYQWRAIEKAIAFRREDRMETVDKFIAGLKPKLKSSNRLATVFALLLSVVITGYFMFFQDKGVDPYSEFDIRNELELKIKIDFYKEDLLSLIQSADFTDPWEDSVWKDVSDLAILTKGEDPWLDEQKSSIYQLYLRRIDKAIDSYKYSRARHLIENARRYTDNPAQLDLKDQQIASAIQRDKERKQRLAKQQQAAMLAQQKNNQIRKQQQSKKKETVEQFNLALSNVKAQLKCQGRLNMRNLDAAITKLRSLDANRFRGIETDIVKSLAACIRQVSKAFPERAMEAKKQSLRIFKGNPMLAAIEIHAKDPCDATLAGLGARGKRASCKDKLKDGGMGPVMVVVPATRKLKAFAIGKYETSIQELNRFCKVSSVCKPVKGRNVSLPASSIDFRVAKSYLKWLSKQTGQKYRLPTRNEWLYAAKSRRRKLDANRNCKLSTRGIQKGENLVATNIGKQNSWGLVNYVGNVQEWVYGKGRKLVAVGGSYAQPMENCDINTTNRHNGKADDATGFRILRELK